MSELKRTSHRIEDPEIAWDVALSAKDERSIAAAKRLIDPIVSEFKSIDDWPIPDTDAHAQLTSKVMGAYAVYPEVFHKLYHLRDGKSGFSRMEMTEYVLDIFEAGELPLSNIVGFDDETDDRADRFDRDADTIELATEALLVHPPSQDFLKRYNLGVVHYLGSSQKGYEHRVTVKDITELVSSTEYLDIETQKIANDYCRMLEVYNRAGESTGGGISKLKLILGMLERVSVYMPDEQNSKEFDRRVLEATSSENTTIANLRELYESGTKEALELLKMAKDEKLSLFNSIVSGAAATYGASEVDG